MLDAFGHPATGLAVVVVVDGGAVVVGLVVLVVVGIVVDGAAVVVVGCTVLLVVGALVVLVVLPGVVLSTVNRAEYVRVRLLVVSTTASTLCRPFVRVVVSRGCADPLLAVALRS